MKHWVKPFLFCKTFVARAAKQSLKGLIRGYQLGVSPWLGPNCRFEPTCSHYAGQAMEVHSLPFALLLILKRLLRCRPGGGYGYDPIPSPSIRKAKFSKEGNF